jgi:hypothetical protein
MEWLQGPTPRRRPCTSLSYALGRRVEAQQFSEIFVPLSRVEQVMALRGERNLITHFLAPLTLKVQDKASPLRQVVM